jgi:hypothetical protein
MILTHVDLIEKLLKYVPSEEKHAQQKAQRKAQRKHDALMSRSGANSM